MGFQNLGSEGRGAGWGWVKEVTARMQADRPEHPLHPGSGHQRVTSGSTSALVKAQLSAPKLPAPCPPTRLGGRASYMQAKRGVTPDFSTSGVSHVCQSGGGFNITDSPFRKLSSDWRGTCFGNTVVCSRYICFSIYYLF